MKVLITGSSSYLGKNLIDLFEKKKIDYVGVDVCKPLNKNCKKIDILNPKIHLKLKHKIDTIIHLAAISNKQECDADPLRCHDVNIKGTINLLDFALKKKIKKFIFASSEWVYENSRNKISSFNNEIDSNNFTNYYSRLKFFTEQIIKINNINSIILRFGIIYGKCTKKNCSVVESLIDKIIKQKKLIIDSRNISRKYIYIDDITHSIYLSLKYKQKKNNNIFDIQGPKQVNLGEIIKIITKKIKKNIIIKERNNRLKNIRKIDSSKSNKLLRFSPKFSIKEGISNIIDNYNEN